MIKLISYEKIILRSSTDFLTLQNTFQTLKDKYESLNIGWQIYEINIISLFSYLFPFLNLNFCSVSLKVDSI